VRSCVKVVGCGYEASECGWAGRNSGGILFVCLFVCLFGNLKEERTLDFFLRSFSHFLFLRHRIMCWPGPLPKG